MHCRAHPLPTAHCPTMAGDRLPRKVMDAKKLASLLRGGPGGPLVIDSRSFVEYNSWHVLSSVNICCSKLVKRRLQQGKVTIAELIQPAVRGQVPGPCHPRPVPLSPVPTQTPITSRGEGRVPRPGTQTGALSWGSLCLLCPQTQTELFESEYSEPFHPSGLVGSPHPSP